MSNVRKYIKHITSSILFLLLLLILNFSISSAMYLDIKDKIVLNLTEKEAIGWKLDLFNNFNTKKEGVSIKKIDNYTLEFYPQNNLKCNFIILKTDVKDNTGHNEIDDRKYFILNKDGTLELEKTFGGDIFPKKNLHLKLRKFCFFTNGLEGGADILQDLEIHIDDKKDNRIPLFKNGKYQTVVLREGEKKLFCVSISNNPDNQKVYYSLSGKDAKYFEVNDKGCFVRVPNKLDNKESEKEFSVVLKASFVGNGEMENDAYITFKLKPKNNQNYLLVDEAPLFKGGRYQTVYVKDGQQIVTKIVLSNNSAHKKVHWSLGGKDAKDFYIDSDGNLYFKHGSKLDNKSFKKRYEVIVNASFIAVGVMENDKHITVIVEPANKSKEGNCDCNPHKINLACVKTLDGKLINAKTDCDWKCVSTYGFRKVLYKGVCLDNKQDDGNDSVAKEQNSNNKLNGERCSSDLILHQNLRAPRWGYIRNGKYDWYTKGIVREAHILQKHLNRLGFNAGKVDGIIGPKTRGAILRLQRYLGTTADGYVGPKTRALLNNSCSGNYEEQREKESLKNNDSYINLSPQNIEIKLNLSGKSSREKKEIINTLIKKILELVKEL